VSGLAKLEGFSKRQGQLPRRRTILQHLVFKRRWRSSPESHGQELARDLARLLDIKDGAHYGSVYVTSQKATAAMRQARRLVDAAEALLR